jgi:hypothetical protein
LLFILLVLALEDSHAQSFVLTGNMAVPRLAHSATLLPDGRVLIAGGADGNGANNRSTAEIYDPATGTFTRSGDMAFARARHAAVSLQDGRVLVVGGECFCEFIPSAELYDPASGVFMSSGHMSVAQNVLSAAVLKNGKALVIGSRTSEVFDPETGAFRLLNNPPYYDGRYYGVTTTLLSDGEVLLASRLGLSLYDSANDGFRQLPIGWNLSGATGTPLLDSSVFLAGGYTDGYGDVASFHTYVYDPATQNLRTTANMPINRDSHTATLLRDGRVLIAGGFNGDGPDAIIGIFRAAELYDPAIGTLASTKGMNRQRDGHAATLLRDGRVLITGGREEVTAELFIPESTQGSVPQVELNSMRYCVGDSWTLRAESIAPLTSVQISGTRDGTPWTIADWQTSGPDGTLVATGKYGADAVGNYTVWLYAGGKTSSSVSVTVKNCS